MLTIKLFNGFSVALRLQGVETRLSVTGQVAQMLAFLALGRGKQFSRAELARALSREGDTELSPGAINTKLWRLRKELEVGGQPVSHWISPGHDNSVGLNGPGAIWIDTHEFSRRAQAALAVPLNRITPAEMDELKAVAALCTGELMSGSTETWVLRERARLKRLHLNILGRLTLALSAAQNFELAIAYAQIILEVDPLREDVHRELMRFYVLNGQRASALQQFERCRSQLRQELAIQPMRETVALYHQIAESALGHDAPVPAAAAPRSLPSAAGTAGQTDPFHHVQEARQLLAQVDSHLQLCLRLHQ